MGEEGILLLLLHLLGTANAADMAWQCLSFSTAAEAVDYRDASVDGGLEDAYDTLYAMIDANCVVTACGGTCEEIVDCVTEAGHLINWSNWEWNHADTLQTGQTIEVVPAADAGYGWTRAAAEYEDSYMSISWWYRSEARSFEYDGEWAEGWPTDGVLSWWTHDYNGTLESQGWDDGTCSWSRRYDTDSDTIWDVSVNGTDLRVWLDTAEGCVRPSGVYKVELNGTYVGLADWETWETIPDADLDTSAASVDCDDADPDRGTCEPENPHDSVDNDCDGVADDGDADDDGFLSPESAGDDCDDDEATTFPGAPDAWGDGVDSDCNGVDPARLPRRPWGSSPLVWTRGGA